MQNATAYHEDIRFANSMILASSYAEPLVLAGCLQLKAPQSIINIFRHLFSRCLVDSQLRQRSETAENPTLRQGKSMSTEPLQLAGMAPQAPISALPYAMGAMRAHLEPRKVQEKRYNLQCYRRVTAVLPPTTCSSQFGTVGNKAPECTMRT